MTCYESEISALEKHLECLDDYGHSFESLSLLKDLITGCAKRLLEENKHLRREVDELQEHNLELRDTVIEIQIRANRTIRDIDEVMGWKP